MNPYTPGPDIAIHQNLSTTEWSQLGNTPQRTNFTPSIFSPVQGRPAWTVCISDQDPANLIAPTVQVIVGQGQVYVGSKSGRLFAFDAHTGKAAWVFQAGGPIIHTAGYHQGRVFVAAMDGCVYALDAGTGKPIWTFSNHRRFGFSTAVLLAADRVFAVDRGGRLFALAMADGAEAWHADVAAPVDQSPAYDDGMVFFASEDMRVHAFHAADGAAAWTSAKLAGLSFRWFHPVVVGGKVIVQSLAYEWTDVAVPKSPALYQYRTPAMRSLFALDEATGTESIVLPCTVCGHDGNQPPPAVTRDGKLVVRWTIRLRPGSGKEGCANIWALEDLATQTIITPLMDPELRAPDGWLGDAKNPWRATLYSGPNENLIASVAGDMVMAFHRIGAYGWNDCHLGGTFDLVHRHTALDAWQPGDAHLKTAGWLLYGNDGNEDGGSNAAVVADGLLYQHLARYNRIVCYRPAASDPPAAKASP